MWLFIGIYAERPESRKKPSKEAKYEGKRSDCIFCLSSSWQQCNDGFCRFDSDKLPAVHNCFLVRGSNMLSLRDNYIKKLFHADIINFKKDHLTTGPGKKKIPQTLDLHIYALACSAPPTGFFSRLTCVLPFLVRIPSSRGHHHRIRFYPALPPEPLQHRALY